MKRYLSMLYRENNYLRVQELSMDLHRYRSSHNKAASRGQL